MREKKIKNLARNIGKGINMKKNIKSLKGKEDQFLVELKESLCELESVVNTTSVLGINLFIYEEKYINIIRALLIEVYGETKCDIIIWWIFESITPEGEVLPLTDEKGKQYNIKTPKQLVKFLKKYST